MPTTSQCNMCLTHASLLLERGQMIVLYGDANYAVKKGA